MKLGSTRSRNAFRSAARSEVLGGEKLVLLCRQCGHRVVAVATPPNCPNCRARAWQPFRPRSSRVSEFESAVDQEPEAPSSNGAPDWSSVEELLAYLVRTRTVFKSAISDSNWISSYEPGRRLMLETDARSSWVQIEHVRACWETFERLGRIHRSDVLEPGRCSAFMMALFGQLPGVTRDAEDDARLVLATAGEG